MPIRPENRHFYSQRSGWLLTRATIMARANHCCEICGVRNYSWRLGADGKREIKVVLTVAHLDHDPANNDPENLKALCQRCHNGHDAAHRAESRKRRRQCETQQASSES